MEVRRKSSSSVHTAANSFSTTRGIELIAESLNCIQGSALQRTRASCTSTGNFLFHFGGYDGQNYSSDFHVYTLNSLLEKVFGLPSLDSFSKASGQTPRFNKGQLLKIRARNGFKNASKYWLSVRIGSPTHDFVRTILSQSVLCQDQVDEEVVGEAFNCLIRGVWPSSEEVIMLLHSLGIQESDIILNNQADSLIERMRFMEATSTCSVLIDEEGTILHLDSDWISKYSGFFSECQVFARENKERTFVQVSNKGFKSYLKVLLSLEFGYELRLTLVEAFEAYDIADYLVSPLVWEVTYLHLEGNPFDWRTSHGHLG